MKDNREKHSMAPRGNRGHGGGPGGPMMRGSSEKVKDFKGTFRRLLRYLKPFQFRLIVVLITAQRSLVLQQRSCLKA